MPTIISPLGRTTPGPLHIQIDKPAIDNTPEDVRCLSGLDCAQSVALNSVCETAKDCARQQPTPATKIESTRAFLNDRIEALKREESALVVVMGEDVVGSIVQALNGVVFSLAPASDQQPADYERGPYLTKRQIHDIKQGGRGRTHITELIKWVPTSDRNCRLQQAALRCLTKKQLDIARTFCPIAQPLRYRQYRQMTQATAKFVLQDAVNNGRITLINDVTIDDLDAFIDTCQCPSSEHFIVREGSRYFCRLQSIGKLLKVYYRSLKLSYDY